MHIYLYIYGARDSGQPACQSIVGFFLLSVTSSWLKITLAGCASASGYLSPALVSFGWASANDQVGFPALPEAPSANLPPTDFSGNCFGLTCAICTIAWTFGALVGF